MSPTDKDEFLFNLVRFMVADLTPNELSERIKDSGVLPGEATLKEAYGITKADEKVIKQIYTDIDNFLVRMWENTFE